MKKKNPIPLSDSRKRGLNLPEQAVWHRTGIHWIVKQSTTFTSCCTDRQKSNPPSSNFLSLSFFFSSSVLVTKSAVHGEEVREDWKALGKKRRNWATGLLEWHGCLWRHHSRGGWQGGEGWVDRGEVGEITGSPPTPSVSLPAPVLSEGGNEGLWRHSSRRRMIVCMWVFTYMCKGSSVQMHACESFNMCTWEMSTRVN